MTTMHPHLIRCGGLLAALAALVACLGLPGRLPAAESALPRLQAELRAARYDRALALADELLAAKDPQADEVHYLKALALFHSKQFAAAAEVAGRLPADHPQSPWRLKAVFLKAQALVEQKQFAAAIYESEAARILSADRKQELVGEIVRFADKLTAKPDPNAPDAPPPDFNKAYKLYDKALAMEISRELRDEVLFKKARAIQQAGNTGQAIQDYQAYLTEYDPAWTGPAGSGSARLPMQNPPPAGKHVAMARYRLAESQLQAGNLVGARMELEDLLKIVTAPAKDLNSLAAELATGEGKQLAAEIRWLMVQTYFTQRPETMAMRNTAINLPNQAAQQVIQVSQVIGNTGGLPALDTGLFVLREGDLDQALKVAREYLTLYPVGSRAVRVAWLIGEVCADQGRSEEAIAAYRDFMAGKGFKVPEGEAADKWDEEIRSSPALHYTNLRMRALYRVGHILDAQKKHEEAIATWRSYIKDYPNGPEWSDSQNAIIDAEFRMGMEALADKNEALAMQRFEAFLREHPLDSRSPRILHVFGAIHELQALESEDSKAPQPEIEASYRKAIDEWAKLVSKYPQSEEARAAILRSAQIREEKLGEHEKALKLYQKAATEFGVDAAQASIARLIRKSLELSAERTFRTNEQAVVRLKTRNIEKCTARLYRIDLQAYFRKIHGITEVEKLDVSLIQPDKTWEVKLDGYAKYKPLTQDIEIPFAGREGGACVVTIGDDDWESTVLVLRSDLEVIVKSSRREVLAFVQDVLANKPAEGVDLLVSDGKAVVAAGKTGGDGVFKTGVEALKDLANVRVFALRKGHAAAFNLDLAGLQLSSGLTAKGYIYTDRPAYLPGETVSLRGVIRDVRDTAYAIPENSEFQVNFTDSKGRILGEQTVKLSRFGTFDAALALPSTAVVGKYVIAAVQERKGKEPLHFQGEFAVRDFKLEKIKLTLDFPRRVWFRGEVIECSLKSEYYWGEALANRPVRCVLPDGRSQTLTTDADGKAKLMFDTTGMTPGSVLKFVAALDGDNITTTELLTLARLGFSIAAKPSQPVVIAGEPFEVGLSATGADGKPAGEALKVTVLRTAVTKVSRILTLLPWSDAARDEVAETKVAEVDAQTDPTTGKATVPLTLEQGGNYRIRVTGTDRFNQTITGACEVLVSAADDATKLRVFADTATLKVGEEAEVRLHSRLDKGLALVTYEGETILRYQILDLKRDYNELPFKVGHDLFPNFRLAAATLDGRELRLASKEFTVERELKVTLKPLKEAFLPGEQGKVEVSVTDQTGKPVEAELSLALVNEALFAVCPDPTVPILEFFQKDARRHAEFRVGATNRFSYPGVTRPVPKELVDEKARLARQQEEAKELEQLQLTLDDQFAPAPEPAPVAQPVVPPVGRNGAAFGGGLAGGGSRNREAQVDQLAEPQGPIVQSEAGVADASRPAKNGHGPAAEAAPRREVRGEGRWLPAIVTNADGKAVATIPLPESTTAWRLTARGCTVETMVGQATAQTLTRKDFFVELKAPSFLREGDEIRVVGRVHNLTDHAGPVSLSLRVLDAKDRAKVLAERERSVEVKAKGGAEVTFDAVKVPALLGIGLELRGKAGANDDSLVQEIPVKPWGLQYAAHAGGTTEADTAAVVGLPGNRPYSSAWMTVAVGPDIRTSVLDMALPSDWAGPCEDMARICPPVWGHHAGDELLAVASALAYANSGKVEETYARRLTDRARALVANLVTSQADDGSWSGQASGHLTTARVFWALIQARQAGIGVSKPALDKAAAWLQKQFEGCDVNDNDSKAVILHALSCDKRADYANCNRLYRDRNALGNATLAYLARAFLNLERREIAAELATILEGKAKFTPDQPVCWDSGCKIAWLNDPDETTALVLLGMAEAMPESRVAAAAAQHLLTARGCFGFASSRANGPAVAALAAWFGKGREQATDIEIGVVVNGREVGTVKASGAQGLRLLEVPRDAVKADKNVVEFKMRGRGRYTYAATLFGFSPDTAATPHEVRPHYDMVQHLHAQLEYRGRPIGAGSSSPVKNLENGQRLNVVTSTNPGHGWAGDNRRYVVELALPPGARMTAESLQANPAWEVGESSILVFCDRVLPTISYELTGYAPGTFRMPPPVVREVGNPGFMTLGPTPELTVLALGEKSPDPYQMNDGEHFALGKCHFDDGDHANAMEHLSVVFKNNPKLNESDLARMLLWIYTTKQFYDARKIIEMFEILRERYPQLEIPYDRILVVGKAYKDIGEFERSWLVFRAAIAASFTNDSGISAVLEDEGRFLGSIDFQQRVWRDYPDTAEVVSSYFALSQLLYQKAPMAHELPKEDGVQPERLAMLKRTADMLLAFLAMFPADPLADDAAFSLCNCMLDLRNHPLVVTLSTEFGARFADSPLAPAFQYMTALGLFWQNKYGEALAAARVVADGDSKDRDFARYILGQVYHAQGKPAEAIDWYAKVKELYPDAAEAIAYFEDKRIALDEVTVFKPGRPVELTLRYRNIKEAFVQVYRVDLMKLYLQQKNLSRITSVQLAGIRPESEQTIALGDGKDYVEKERKVALKLTDEAAYLAICRGDDLFASGMVLVTPLKIEVQEDPASGRVRANVLDTAKGGYRPDVHVKAIGSADGEFRGGETDLRGLFIADNLRGKATVIAREGDSRYAFFRGEQWLGAPENAPATPAAPAQQAPDIDYRGNLKGQNDAIQEFNGRIWNEQRRQAPNKGVKTKEAF